MDESEHRILAQFCKTHLDFSKLTFDGYYQHLPLCVIDAVFSIGAHYTSTRNTVEKFAQHFKLDAHLVEAVPSVKGQVQLRFLIEAYDKLGVNFLTETVYQNRQRTSTRNGILKSEAVLRFSRVLDQYGIRYIQDVDSVIGQSAFERAIQQIPGQTSGVCLRYFYILAGSSEHVKPDRMILRFIQSALGKVVSAEQGHRYVVEACKILQQTYPSLTPAILDNQIWNYQRLQR